MDHISLIQAQTPEAIRDAVERGHPERHHRQVTAVLLAVREGEPIKRVAQDYGLTPTFVRALCTRALSHMRQGLPH